MRGRAMTVAMPSQEKLEAAIRDAESTSLVDVSRAGRTVGTLEYNHLPDPERYILARIRENEPLSHMHQKTLRRLVARALAMLGAT
jgi:hypothetical protein